MDNQTIKKMGAIVLAGSMIMATGVGILNHLSLANSGNSPSNTPGISPGISQGISIDIAMNREIPITPIAQGNNDGWCWLVSTQMMLRSYLDGRIKDKDITDDFIVGDMQRYIDKANELNAQWGYDTKKSAEEFDRLYEEKFIEGKGINGGQSIAKVIANGTTVRLDEITTGNKKDIYKESLFLLYLTTERLSQSDMGKILATGGDQTIQRMVEIVLKAHGIDDSSCYLLAFNDAQSIRESFGFISHIINNFNSPVAVLNKPKDEDGHFTVVHGIQDSNFIVQDTDGVRSSLKNANEYRHKTEVRALYFIAKDEFMKKSNKAVNILAIDDHKLGNSGMIHYQSGEDLALYSTSEDMGMFAENLGLNGLDGSFIVDGFTNNKLTAQTRSESSKNAYSLSSFTSAPNEKEPDGEMEPSALTFYRFSMKLDKDVTFVSKDNKYTELNDIEFFDYIAPGDGNDPGNSYPQAPSGFVMPSGGGSNNGFSNVSGGPTSSDNQLLRDNNTIATLTYSQDQFTSQGGIPAKDIVDQLYTSTNSDQLPALPANVKLSEINNYAQYKDKNITVDIKDSKGEVVATWKFALNQLNPEFTKAYDKVKELEAKASLQLDEKKELEDNKKILESYNFNLKVKVPADTDKNSIIQQNQGLKTLLQGTGTKVVDFSGNGKFPGTATVDVNVGANNKGTETEYIVYCLYEYKNDKGEIVKVATMLDGHAKVNQNGYVRFKGINYDATYILAPKTTSNEKNKKEIGSAIASATQRSFEEQKTTTKATTTTKNTKDIKK